MIYYKTTLLVADRFSFPIKAQRSTHHRIPSTLRVKIKESITQYAPDFVDTTLSDIEQNYLLPSEKEVLQRLLKVPASIIHFEQYALTSPEKIFDCMKRYELDFHTYLTSYYAWVKLPIVSKSGFSICIDNALYFQDINYREALQQLKITT
jgi:hypothetical protein